MPSLSCETDLLPLLNINFDAVRAATNGMRWDLGGVKLYVKRAS